MNFDELARAAGEGVFHELVRDGMKLGQEMQDRFGLNFSEEELQIFEVGVNSGVVAATKWFEKHGMLKDLEIERGSG